MQRPPAALHLLDDGFRRRRVALLSGEARDLSQPLLSPLYYINRALTPYADLVEPHESGSRRRHSGTVWSRSRPY